jgi:hypothetical protein
MKVVWRLWVPHTNMVIRLVIGDNLFLPILKIKDVFVVAFATGVRVNLCIELLFALISVSDFALDHNA